MKRTHNFHFHAQHTLSFAFEVIKKVIPLCTLFRLFLKFFFFRFLFFLRLAQRINSKFDTIKRQPHTSFCGSSLFHICRDFNHVYSECFWYPKQLDFTFEQYVLIDPFRKAFSFAPSSRPLPNFFCAPQHNNQFLSSKHTKQTNFSTQFKDFYACNDIQHEKQNRIVTMKKK